MKEEEPNEEENEPEQERPTLSELLNSSSGQSEGKTPAAGSSDNKVGSEGAKEEDGEDRKEEEAVVPVEDKKEEEEAPVPEEDKCPGNHDLVALKELWASFFKSNHKAEKFLEGPHYPENCCMFSCLACIACIVDTKWYLTCALLL